MKPFMVGCCGCGKLLTVEGGLTDFSVLGAGGILNREAVEGATSKAATFATKEECDSAAKAAGWTVTLDGNHRCAPCHVAHRSQRHGMYIDSRTLEVCA